MAASLDRLAANYSVTLVRHAFELRPPGSPPMSPAFRERIEASRPQLIAHAKERYGLDLAMGPLGISSRAAHVGLKIAAAAGLESAYEHAVLNAYWLEGRDISDLTVLGEIVANIGLEPEAFLAQLEDPALIEAVEEDSAIAVSSGITAVPAVVFAERFLVMGAQPYELLERTLLRAQTGVA